MGKISTVFLARKKEYYYYSKLQTTTESILQLCDRATVTEIYTSSSWRGTLGALWRHLSGVANRERADKRRNYNRVLGAQLHVTIPGVASILMGTTRSLCFFFKRRDKRA